MSSSSSFSSAPSVNKKSSSIKRILSEAREMCSDASTEYTAAPLEDNLFEWHFTLRGARGTEFEQGIYHGRIILPVEYPFRPPSVILLTPNGRWETGKKICLTFTGFHEECWAPAWGIRTALLGVQAFMNAKKEAAVGVGALDVDGQERERMAKASRDWTCHVCAKKNAELLPETREEDRKVECLPEGLHVREEAPPPAKQQQEEGEEEEEEERSTNASTLQVNKQSQVVAEPTEAGTAAAADQQTDSPPMHALANQESPTMISSTVVQDQLRLSRTEMDRAAANRAASSASDSPTLTRRREARVDTAPASHATDAAQRNVGEATLIWGASGEATVVEAGTAAVDPAAREPVPAPRTPSPSEARVAQLDRAIGFVCLLLAGLLVRRIF